MIKKIFLPERPGYIGIRSYSDQAVTEVSHLLEDFGIKFRSVEERFKTKETQEQIARPVITFPVFFYFDDEFKKLRKKLKQMEQDGSIHINVMYSIDIETTSIGASSKFPFLNVVITSVDNGPFKTRKFIYEHPQESSNFHYTMFSYPKDYLLVSIFYLMKTIDGQICGLHETRKLFFNEETKKFHINQEPGMILFKEKIKFDFPYANKLKKTFLSKIPVIDDIETARSFADKFLGLVKPERNQIISIQKVQKAPRNANSQKGSEKRPKNGPYSNRNSETRQRSIPR